MKKLLVLLFFAAFAATFQTKAQSLKEVGTICGSLGQDSLSKANASNRLSEVSVPEVDKKNMMIAISYFYLKYLLAQMNQEQFKTSEYGDAQEARKIVEEKIRQVENSLDTIIMVSTAFETMPKGNLFSNLFLRNTQKKLLKYVPCLDPGRESFTNLSGQYQISLKELKREDSLIAQRLIENRMGDALDSITKDFKLSHDSLEHNLDEIKNGLEVSKKEIESYKIMLQDSLEKSTRKMADESNVAPAVKDSVFLKFTVHNIDSIKFEVYIMQEHGVAEYCNAKVNAIIKNAVFGAARKWFNLLGTDTLSISATITGEADDIWLKKGERHTFREDKDCSGIGKILGLKDGDKISNDTIAILRTLSAEQYFDEGIKKTLSFLQKEKGKKYAYINIQSIDRSHKNWMLDPGVQEASRFRKETIVLKCHSCGKLKVKP